MNLPKRLTELPETGKVVVANPSQAGRAVSTALLKGTDYILHEYVPREKIFIMDMDEFNKMPDAHG